MQVTANQMTGTEMNAVTDDQQEASGGYASGSTQTIDFAIGMKTATGITPAVDGITVAYEQSQYQLRVMDEDTVRFYNNSAGTVTAKIEVSVSGNGGGSTFWAQATGGINFAGGNVGIGTTTPSALFSVGASSQFQVDTSGNVQTSGIIDGSAGGIATKVVSGAVTDGSFTGTPVNGLVALDSSNGRVYFRYGGGWHYVDQTGGFQIPNYEVAPIDQLDEAGREARETMLTFESSAYPQYMSEKLAPGDFLIPYVDQYMEDGAVHGLYARFDDVKNLMFKEEKEQLADLVLKTDYNVSTIKELQDSIDSNLDLVSSNLQGLAGSIAELEDAHDERLDNLEDQAQQLTGRTEKLEAALAQNDLIKSELEFIKQLVSPAEDGTLTLYGKVALVGKLDAEGVITSMLEIKNASDTARTIGQAEIVPAAAQAGPDGEIVRGSGTDGKSAIVSTTAVSDTAKIFYSFENDPDSVSWVEKVKDPTTNEYTGFVIRLKQEVSTGTRVSWWIVKENGAGQPAVSGASALPAEEIPATEPEAETPEISAEPTVEEAGTETPSTPESTPVETPIPESNPAATIPAGETTGANPET